MEQGRGGEQRLKVIAVFGEFQGISRFLLPSLDPIATLQLDESGCDIQSILGPSHGKGRIFCKGSITLDANHQTNTR